MNDNKCFPGMFLKYIPNVYFVYGSIPGFGRNNSWTDNYAKLK